MDEKGDPALSNNVEPGGQGLAQDLHRNPTLPPSSRNSLVGVQDNTVNGDVFLLGHFPELEKESRAVCSTLVLPF